MIIMIGYWIGAFAGFFWIMALCEIIAIIVARKFISWTLFLLGSGLTLLSLMGHQKQANLYRSFGFESNLTPYWVVFGVLLAVGAVIIASRIESCEYAREYAKNKESKKEESVVVPEKKVQEKTPKQVVSRPRPVPVEESPWKCPNCGIENSSNYGQCKKCGSYRKK